MKRKLMILLTVLIGFSLIVTSAHAATFHADIIGPSGSGRFGLRVATLPNGSPNDIGAHKFDVVDIQTGPSYVVNTNADTDDGFCDLFGQGTGNQDCTLREAINVANSNSDVSEITFAENYTITLIGSQLPAVTSIITITGKGAANTIIQANAYPNTATYRVFEVFGNLTIDGLTVRNGRCIGPCSSSLVNGYGGGIDNIAGILTVKNSIISSNSGIYNGGIFNAGGGTLTVINSTISDNYGGGIYNAAGGQISTLIVTNSTIASNYGSGIINESIANITNSTFSANSAMIGGGIDNLYGTLTVINSTFSGNSAINGGGGIYNWYSSPILTNVIMADQPVGGDCTNFGSNTLDVSSSNNLIDDGSNACGLINGVKGNIIGRDPKLGMLANNGGPTQTNALLPGSPAINAGTDSGCPATDQRGIMRPKESHCDIGAYEFAGYFTITGNAGVADVTLTYTDGTPQFVTADGSGNYSINVPFGWSGTVTPYTIGYSFTPVNRTYSSVQANQTGQDYTTQSCSACADRDTTGVFRPSNGLLYLKNLNITGFADVAINYGLGGDYPVVGDWDGNGTATIGIYRNGSFYLRNSNTLGFGDLVFAFGQPGDQPIAGDWNGDGVDTIGVYRPSTGQFLLRNDNSAGTAEYSFYLGNVGDVGIAGDWNGDGKDTTGVFRPSNGVIFLKNTNQTGFADIALNYGLAGDQPVTGDWNGDDIDTIGVYRNGQFLLRNSNTIGFADISFYLGIPGDMPIAGDWDGIP